MSVVGMTSCASKNAVVAKRSTPIAEPANPIIFDEEAEAAEKGELPTFDIPVVRNAKVEVWLDYFQGRGRKWMSIWLERSGKYVPFMRKILRDHGLPEDLVNLAMIESGFSARAYSRARAVGPWQFMKATGRIYGLRSDFWVDERRDPEKSSIAAARHLKDLYDQFQSWKLAAAAYNAGSGKVQRAIRRYKTEDFWELTKGKYLKPETRNYVPKMIAAALIAKEPAKYGFVNIQYESPLEYDKVIVPFPINLFTLSQKANVDLEAIMDMNPELNHPVTPPAVEAYELRVPSGTSHQFMMALNSFTDDDKAGYTAHRIRRGDTLARLSAIYRVSQKNILKANNLKTARDLRPGRDIVIPRQLNQHLADLGQKAYGQENQRKPRRNSRRNAVRSVYKTSSSERQDSKKKEAVRVGS